MYWLNVKCRNSIWSVMEWYTFCFIDWMHLLSITAQAWIMNGKSVFMLWQSSMTFLFWCILNIFLQLFLALAHTKYMSVWVYAYKTYKCISMCNKYTFNNCSHWMHNHVTLHYIIIRPRKDNKGHTLHPFHNIFCNISRLFHMKSKMVLSHRRHYTYYSTIQVPE